jgi:hypothetical protein
VNTRRTFRTVVKIGLVDLGVTSGFMRVSKEVDARLKPLDGGQEPWAAKSLSVEPFVEHTRRRDM